MVIWWILGILALLIVLILCLRVGAEVSFGEELRVVAKIGPAKITILPRPEKPKKEVKPDKKPKKKAQKAKKPTEEKPKAEPFKPTFQDIKEGFPTLFAALKRALGKTRRRMRIDPLRVSIIFGGPDPVDLTQAYGWANTAMWTVMPQLEELMNIPNPHIHLEPDFERPATHISGSLGLSFRVGDFVNIGLTAGIPALRWYLSLRKKNKPAKPANTTQTA